MKKENSVIENIEWLISQYKRDSEIEEDLELKNAYENIVIELTYIINLSK